MWWKSRSRESESCGPRWILVAAPRARSKSRLWPFSMLVGQAILSPAKAPFLFGATRRYAIMQSRRNTTPCRHRSARKEKEQFVRAEDAENPVIHTAGWPVASFDSSRDKDGGRPKRGPLQSPSREAV